MFDIEVTFSPESACIKFESVSLVEIGAGLRYTLIPGVCMTFLSTSCNKYEFERAGDTERRAYGSYVSLNHRRPFASNVASVSGYLVGIIFTILAIAKERESTDLTNDSPFYQVEQGSGP